MIVLSRRIGERLLIGDNIVITVVDSDHASRCSLGIDAPKGVGVLREDAKKRQAPIRPKLSLRRS